MSRQDEFMVNLQVHVPGRLRDELRELARREGVSMAEEVRDALRCWVDVDRAVEVQVASGRLTT